MAYRKRTAVRRIVDPAQIALFASGIRQEIVDTLESLGGEAEVAEIARQLGRPADGLYYHLDLLAKGGLLDAEEAGGARRYRLARKKDAVLQLDYRSGGEKACRASVRVIDSMLKIAGRDFREALADPHARIGGPRRDLWASRGKGWVSESELGEINRLLSRLNDLLRGPRRPGRDRLVSLCYVLAPVAAQPVRRGSEPADE